MANLYDTLTDIYSRNLFLNRYYYGRRTEQQDITDSCYTEIFVGDEEFEIPCFAFHAFMNAVKTNRQCADKIDVIVARLNKAACRSPYKSLEASVNYSYTLGLDTTGLVEVKAKPNEPAYYVSFGLIANENLKPLVMHSWKVRRIDVPEGGYRYKLEIPIMRVSPNVFVDRSDTMRRFITGKLTSTALSLAHFPMSYPGDLRYCIDGYITGYHRPSIDVQPKVLIEDSPFIIKKTNTPSISTNSEQLRHLALNYLEDIIV